MKRVLFIVLLTTLSVGCWGCLVGCSREDQKPKIPKGFQPKSYYNYCIPVPNNDTWSIPRSKKKITNNEIKELTEELFQRDVNNLAKFIEVNYQGRTNPNSNADAAPKPLIKVQNKIFRMPTISNIYSLYDNYIHDSLVDEVVTIAELTEEDKFLDVVMATPVMKHTMKFLVDKGFVNTNYKEQKRLLRRIWFDVYSRGAGIVGSSAFEHVFMGEVKHGQVSGMHNWVYFSCQEDLDRANYLGFMNIVPLGNKGAIAKIHFKWGRASKPVGSMFIGTSPELEMSLYTLCFLARPDQRCYVRLAGKNFSIRTHSIYFKGKKRFSSAFPEI